MICHKLLGGVLNIPQIHLKLDTVSKYPKTIGSFSGGWKLDQFDQGSGAFLWSPVTGLGFGTGMNEVNEKGTSLYLGG